MPLLDPAAHKLDLRAALEAQGWEVEVVESAAEAWCMHELWRARSRWRPVGATLFVSLVGDQGEERRPPQRVGDVAVGRAPLSDIHACNAARFPLAPYWPAQLANIVAHAGTLRDEPATAHDSPPRPLAGRGWGWG
jgi:hypothetical protein